MKKKILCFIVNNNNKLLALRNNFENLKYGGDFWFVVTGGVDNNESYKDAAIREIKEETNLDVDELFFLNWESKYIWNNEICKELNYIAFVKDGKIVLNEENIDFKWLNKDDFINLIKWEDDKKILKKVLEKGLEKEVFFKKLCIVNYIK